MATCSKLRVEAAEDGGGLIILEARLGGRAGTRLSPVTVVELARVLGRRSSELAEADPERELDEIDFVLEWISPGRLVWPPKAVVGSLVGLMLRVLTLLLELPAFELLLRTSRTLSFSSFCSAFLRLDAIRPACKLC